MPQQPSTKEQLMAGRKWAKLRVVEGEDSVRKRNVVHRAAN